MQTPRPFLHLWLWQTWFRGTGFAVSPIVATPEASPVRPSFDRARLLRWLVVLAVLSGGTWLSGVMSETEALASRDRIRNNPTSTSDNLGGAIVPADPETSLDSDVTGTTPPSNSVDTNSIETVAPPSSSTRPPSFQARFSDGTEPSRLPIGGWGWAIAGAAVGGTLSATATRRKFRASWQRLSQHTVERIEALNLSPSEKSLHPQTQQGDDRATEELEHIDRTLATLVGAVRYHRSVWDSLLQASPTAAVVLTADAAILSCNAAAAQLLGQAHEDLPQQPLATFLLLSDPHFPDARLQNLENWPPGFPLKGTILRPDRGPFPVELKLGVDSTSENDIRYILCLRDISSERQLLAVKEAREQSFAAIVDSSTDGFWDWHLARKQMSFSQCWLDAIGVNTGDVSERPQEWFSRVHPSDFRALKTAIVRHIKGETAALECEYRLRHRDGSYRWMRSRGRAIRDKEGKVCRIAGSQTDLTYDRELDAEIRRLQLHRKALVSCSFDPIIAIDTDGKIIEFNPAAERTFGYSREQVVGMDMAFLFVSPSHQHIRQHTERYRHWQSDVAIGKRLQVKARRANGPKFLAEISISRIPVADSVLFNIVTRDITKRLEAAAALQESEERYALAVRGANDGIWDWALKTNKVYFSPRWKSLLGYSENEIGSNFQEWLDRVHPEDCGHLKQDLVAHLEGETSHFENEHRLLDRHGNYRWMLSRGLAVRDSKGRAYRMAGSQTDITDRKRAEAELRQGAYYDTLTKLPNRAFFMEKLKQALHRSKLDSRYIFGVLFLDFDRFKVINDSLGHLVGDRLLCEIALRLQEAISPPDTVGRIGGDEFVILLQDINTPAAATQAAERIFANFRKPFFIDDREIFTAASIGIVSQTSGYSRPEDILRDADLAMYRAKANGKGQYAVFDAAMRAQAMARLQTETDLRRAIEREEFSLHYQPIISLTDRCLVGFEALLRWQHPERGLITPVDFIEIAEETGSIVELGKWVLHTACKQLTAWTNQFPTCKHLTMGINVSSQQLLRPEFVQQVQRILQMNDINPSSLKLEITESVIMENLDLALSRLDDLHALGTQVYIDDFGTGYSSFSYLQRLPVDALKIDRAFVSQIGSSSNSWQIVQSIVTLAHALGLKVVAEGVETDEQLLCLHNLHCEFAQGYGIARPVSAETASSFLSESSLFQFQLADVNGNSGNVMQPNSAQLTSASPIAFAHTRRSPNPQTA